MVDEPVDDRVADDRVLEHLVPFGEGPVGGDDHRPLLVPRRDDLEEHVRDRRLDREVPDFVDDEELVFADVLDHLGLPGLGDGLPHPGDQVPEVDEVGRDVAVGRLDAQGDGEVGLADSGRTDEDDVLPVVEEAERLEVQHPLPVQARLEGEVESVERLPRREVRELEVHVRGAFVAEPYLLVGEFPEALDERLAVAGSPVDVAGEVLVDLGELEAGEVVPQPPVFR